MPRPATDKRARLTAAAAQLTYSRGLQQTTIADVADAAGVAQGSVFYYFKTKDDVGRAVVDSLESRYTSLLGQWEQAADPRERLTAFVDQYLGEAETLKMAGCPVGSLCTELRKISSDLGDQAAGVFRMMIGWTAAQFQAIGFASAPAQSNAMHLVASIQGAALLTNALDSTDPIERESARLKDWISTVQP